MRNLPSYGRWQKEFAPRGVEIIGVHTPETEAERNLENVKKKIGELKITYPVLVDREGANWRRWKQQWWPTVYLIDKKGVVRYGWAGELDWKGAGGEAKLRTKILELLAEKG